MRNTQYLVAAWLLLGAAALVRAQAANRQPGIYVENAAAAESGDPVRLRSFMVRDFKQTGMIKVMLSQGHAKGNVLGLLPGRAAAVRVPSGVTFRFYVNPSGNGPTDLNAALGIVTGDYMPAKTADEFVLVPVESTKDDRRQVELGQYGNGGGKPKSAMALTVERVSPTEFKVSPKMPLGAGEYAFCWMGQSNGAGGVVWDFGVD